MVNLKKQADVLPSKKGILNYITSKSCEQILITKEHIATHTNCFVLQYFSNKTFLKVVFYAKIPIGQSFFYKLRNPHGTPTFKTEVLRLVSNVQLHG